MPRTSVTVYPNNWREYDEPYSGLNWTEQGSAGQASLKDYDSNYLVATNTTGLSIDSETARGYTLRKSDGNLPTFPADARNPSVEITVIGKSNTGTARIAGGYVNTANGKYATSESFANLTTSNAPHSKVMDCGDGENVFGALAADQYVIHMLYASRPSTDGSTSCYLDQYSMTVTYDYGPDDVPDQFYFNDSAAPASTAVVSNVITVAGTTPGTALSASFTSDGGAMTALVNGVTSYGPGVAFTVYNGDTIQMRGTTPATTGQKYNATFTINGVSDAWAALAGTDVPSSVTKPSAVSNLIPGTWYPNANYSPAGNTTLACWQLGSFTVPMKFHFKEDDCEWSRGNANGPWTTGTTEGEAPASSITQIYYRAKSAPTPGSSRTVTLVYSSQNLESEFVMPNGNESTQHYVDLSPIQASQESVPATTPTGYYSPTPSGSMHHFAVQTKVTANTTAAGTQAQVSGEWWRLKSDGSLPVWPTGTKIDGICCGTASDTSTGGYSGIISFQGRCQNAATGAMDVSIGTHDVLNLGNLQSRNLSWFVNGVIASAPAVQVPTGWTATTLDAAIKADAFRWGTAGYISPAAQLSTGCLYKVMRVYFKITKPPEGMAWEA